MTRQEKKKNAISTRLCLSRNRFQVLNLVKKALRMHIYFILIVPFCLQWIFWVGPFLGAALAAAYHQYILRAGPFKALGSFRSTPGNHV